MHDDTPPMFLMVKVTSLNIQHTCKLNTIFHQNALQSAGRFSIDISNSTNKRQRREEEEEEDDDVVVIETVLSTVSFSYAYHHYFSCLIILSLNFDFLWQKPNNKSGIMHI